jgi:hypothetical protein
MADFVVSFWQQRTDREAGQLSLLHCKVVAGASAQAAVDAAVLDDQIRSPEFTGDTVITCDPVYLKS